jgi:aspartate ammonia-lyase
MEEQKGKPPTRRESDSLGEVEVPAQAYYGAQTARAIENFPLSGLRAHPEMIAATALVKKAAARANRELGALSEEVGKAIETAADEVIAGKWRDQFVVDVFQAGAGTSHNMNMNEVLANRAEELLGGNKGRYRLVHPNDHVNRSQSTNDVFPTAMRLASRRMLASLLHELARLEEAFRRKAAEFDDILKSGRTHLQDATPVRLGQEFAAYAVAMKKCRRRIEAAGAELEEIGLGATAVGSGLNASRRYREKVVAHLRESTAFPLRPAEDYFELTQNLDAFAHVSAALRTLALNLIRIANDLRLLSSGPKTGLAEISLPPVQPGSSIMPGKVNPVIAEALNMVCFQVVGNDQAVALACQAGQLELNVMMPGLAHALFQSLEILTNGVRVFAERCVGGISADRERCETYAEQSAALAAALSPALGYALAAELAQESLRRNKPLLQLVRERRLLPEEELSRLLSLREMTEPPE